MNVDFSLFTQAIGVGWLGFIAWMALQLLATLIRLGWNWVNEGDNFIYCNFLNSFCAKMAGWEVVPGKFYERLRKGNHSSDVFFWVFIPAVALLATPVALVIVAAFWQYFTGLAIMVGLMYLTRFCVRMNKILRRHMEDKNGHR